MVNARPCRRIEASSSHFFLFLFFFLTVWLYLKFTQMPTSRDLAPIMTTTNRQTDYFIPCACTKGNITTKVIVALYLELQALQLVASTSKLCICHGSSCCPLLWWLNSWMLSTGCCERDQVCNLLLIYTTESSSWLDWWSYGKHSKLISVVTIVSWIRFPCTCVGTLYIIVVNTIPQKKP